MKISVILAHPNQGSFNHPIAKVSIETLNKNGHEVRFHDLCEEKFDSTLPQTLCGAGPSQPLDIQDERQVKWVYPGLRTAFLGP